MTKIIHKTGDIFTTTARGIGHGVNTEGVMGAGIAKQFKDRFPVMYIMYRANCLDKIMSGGDTFVWPIISETEGSLPLYIYNIASQEAPGPNAQLDWLRTGVIKAVAHADQMGLDVIALPRIGSGIGGLDEAEVEAVLTEIAASTPVDIELWTFS